MRNEEKKIRQETEDIKMFFKKFFSPFRDYVKTDEEKEKAFGISKVLSIDSQYIYGIRDNNAAFKPDD